MDQAQLSCIAGQILYRLIHEESPCMLIHVYICKLNHPSHVWLQGIFPTQESNPGLPHCRQILYQLSYEEKLMHAYTRIYICKLSRFSHLWLFVTLWTVACQTLSVEFPRQEHWSGLPCPPPGIFPTQGSNPRLPHCRADSLPLSHPESPYVYIFI